MSVPALGHGVQAAVRGDAVLRAARVVPVTLLREKRMEILERSSPNFGPRRDGLRPELVVLHHTAMLTAEAALERLCDPAAEVSAHYLDRRGRPGLAAGRPRTARAWHAGAGSWGGAGDVNSRSIGIELANAGPLAGFPPFPEPQMAALEALLDGIMARWAIPPAGVIAHSDMAPERKSDPGPKFDWRRLARGGRAVWPDDAPRRRPAGRRSAAPRRRRATPRPTATGRRCSRRRGCASGPGRRGEPEAADVAAMRACSPPCVDRGAVPT